ncbi:MAG: dockerin type I repeat-containing protein [Bacteroidaceae bacterium]|nr:dockerin type I repeat-containing protein [Bacteroidaceae bacterium]
MIACIAARGQTLSNVNDIDLSGLPQASQAKQLCFWFDDDVDAKQIVNPVSGHYELDVSDLFEGMHTLHYQVINTKDEVTYIASRIFLKVGFENAEENSVGSLNYWFDDNIDVMQTDNAANVILDVSTLQNGLHTLHYQVHGRDGNVYYIASNYFIKIDDAEIIKAEKLMYWFDNDVSIQHTEISNGTKSLDTSILTEGLHTLHYQIADIKGNLCPPQSSIFLKMDWSQSSTTAKRIRYWYDEEASVEETSVLQGTQTLETERLVEGLHTLHYQIVDSNGSVGTPVSSLFLKINASVESEAKDLRYWFDDDVSTITTMNASNGTQTLDVSELPTGLHTINYQLIDSQGNATVPIACYFMKASSKVVAEGENRIIKYQYWLNQNSQAMQTVELDAATNPYTLITLLPIQKEPILSSCFQFEVTNGQPTIYARNTLHVRFHDSQGYFTDACKQYVDERVSEAITNIEPIFSDVTKHINSPEENTIKWFSMEAVRGDSLAIKSDYACTLQLFSPSGKEVYNVNGPNSIVFGGIHAEEDGTYYMAVHDVTARNTSSMNVDYKHIDKYAVLSYTPDSIGTMTAYVEVALNGNGYDKLRSAILCMNNNMIKADSIEIVSKSKSILRFRLWGDEEHGAYDLKLKFQDKAEVDSIIVNQAMIFVEEEMGDIKVDVISHRVVGYPYPVSIKVTNTGNVSMMYVPFKIACTFNLLSWEATASPGQSAWASMQPMNFSLAFDADYDPDKNEYYAPYNPYTLSYDLFGTGLPGMVVNMFIPTLGPHETKEFVVGFIGSGHAKFNLYAWTGVPMNSNYDDTDEETNIYSVWKYIEEYQKWKEEQQEQAPAPLRRRAPLDHIGHLNNLFNVSDQLSGGASLAGRSAVAAGLGTGGYVNGLRLQGIHAYTDNDDFAKDVLADYESDVRQNIPTPGQIAGIMGMPGWLQALLGLQDRQASCGNPMPLAHEIEIWSPGDPNDLIGYTSESGSKFMREEITSIPYTIEFENDPEIANASAHTIIVTDTLDTELFDLSTFEPTSVKIGNVVMNLDGEKQFTRSMDLRPSIDVIAEVSLDYNEAKGIARWTITSLDPMSMEPTQDAMQGALPVNVNGNGMGEVSFNIKLKQKLTHEQSVSNRAAIVFDKEAVIMTPTWTNTVDAVAPTSVITDVSMASASTAAITVSAIDELSKPWKYDVYQRLQDSEEWTRAAVNIPVDSVVIIPVGNSKTYEYYVLATDSAGNVEVKEPQCEFRFTTSMLKGDINSDGEVTAQDASLVQQLVAGKITLVDKSNADVNNDGKVDAQDASLIQQYVAGKISW